MDTGQESGQTTAVDVALEEEPLTSPTLNTPIEVASAAVFPFERSKHSALQEFLSFMVFEGSGLRFAIELVLCLTLFFFIDSAMIATKVFPVWHSFTAWSIACLLIAVLDHRLILPPLIALQRACSLSALANWKGALAALELVAPEARRLVTLSQTRYHLYRALFLLGGSEFAAARACLEQARASGASPHAVAAIASQISSAEGSFASGHSELTEVRAMYGDSPLVDLHESLLLVDERKDLKTARKGFDEVLGMTDVPHPSGASVHAIARAYREVCRLWTGYAEEAIDSLSRECEILTAAYNGHDLFRPLLARLYLERGYYFATHKEPDRARHDLRVGQLLCRHANLEPLAQKIEDELAWRYPHAAK